MFILLGKYSQVIDIVDTLKCVKTNDNGCDVICEPYEAEAYIGSDNSSVYKKVSAKEYSTLNIVYAAIEVESVPEDLVKPYQYKYIDGEFVFDHNPNLSESELCSQYIMSNIANMEYISMMSDIPLKEEVSMFASRDMHSPKFDKVKRFYDKGFWDIAMVGNAVANPASNPWITAEEFTEITGQSYE